MCSPSLVSTHACATRGAPLGAAIAVKLLPGLVMPGALEAAAHKHADYLAQLGRSTVLLRRQVLLVLREPLGPTQPTDGLGGASPRNRIPVGLQ